MRANLIWAVIFAAIVAIGVIVQMNRYEYANHQVVGVSYVVRIDRLTGAKCFFSGPAGMAELLQLPPPC